jgi:putative aldouronate transport system permease protein
MTLSQRDGFGIRLIGHIVLIVLTILAIMPFWLLIASSFTDEHTVLREGYRFFPSLLSTSAYSYIFTNWAQIGRAYGIQIIGTIVGTFLGILVTTMMAYGLSKRDIKGVRVLFILVLITMLFNGGIVPSFYVYTNIIPIRNTIFALIVPNLLMSGFTVMLVKNYIQNSIPHEMLEAAEVDGAGQFTIFFRFIIPLSTPILATVGLLSAVTYWNDWTNGLYFITDPKLFSVQLMLNRMNENILFLASNAANLGPIDLSNLPTVTMRMAIAVVAILPIIITYPFFQKYFAKGITMGAIKA